MRPLFLTRSYPPSVGGLERFAYSLSRELERLGTCTTIANHRGKRGLPFFLPYCLGATVVTAKRTRSDLIHLSDALMAPVGALLKSITGLPVTASIHGLDLTFDNQLYQAVLSRSITKLDHLMAVSKATRDICVERWPQLADRVTVVPNGVEARDTTLPEFKLSPEVTSFVKGKRTLLTVGRLVQRKGVAWFLRDVMTLLPEDVVYLVAGEGPERAAIEQAAKSCGLLDRVMVLGRVEDGFLEALYACADVFVMPNVLVSDDVEGFGLVALEAAVRGLPVVASNLQGIPEAVHHDSNGFLVQTGNAGEFAMRIMSVADLTPRRQRNLGAKFQTYTLETFSWRKTAEGYWRQFEAVCRMPQTGSPSELRQSEAA